MPQRSSTETRTSPQRMWDERMWDKRMRLSHISHHNIITKNAMALNHGIFYLYVGATGFEPATTWSQTRSATGLRYTPLLNRFAR